MPDASARAATGATRGQVAAALGALYLIWGSTYLAIRFAIETIPPFMMAGARFVAAGLVLWAFANFRGWAPRWPSAREWVAGTVIGALLLLGGNGAVVWAEQRVPSGIAALLVATVPLWIVLVDWARPGGRRPTLGVAVGLLLGLAGLVLLVGLDGLRGTGGVDLLGALVLTFGSITWAVGSILGKRMPLPKHAIAATGLEMFCGGVLLFALGAAVGEFGTFDPSAVSTRSLLAWGYLFTFGSLIGFTAYIWLLGVVSPAKASTYAYVNPVVAVLLGWAFANEPLTARMFVAAAIIIAAVALITVAQSGQPASAPTPAAAAPDERPRRRKSKKRPRTARAG
jgi:drug/metabolite transporter (DMT)-like permease